MRPLIIVKLAALVLVALSSRAFAAAPAVINVEVEEEKLATQDDLPWSTSEPFGLEVPATANAYWLQIGCAIGDVVDRIDNDPVSSSQSVLREGVHILELRRKGKPVLLRVVVHGPIFRTEHLKADNITTLADDLKDVPTGQLVAPLKRGGVRIQHYRLHGDVGLEPGDIVRTFEGARIESEADLRRVFASIPVGHSDLVVERNGRTITITWEREP